MGTARRVLLLLPLALLPCCATRGAPQPQPEPQAPANPYTASQIERLLRGGVPVKKILADAQRECIAFRVDAHAGELARAGASASFLGDLRAACYQAAVPVK